VRIKWPDFYYLNIATVGTVRNVFCFCKIGVSFRKLFNVKK
jgi:hypothetical protein